MLENQIEMQEDDCRAPGAATCQEMN